MLNWMRGVLIGGFLLAVSVVPGQEHKRARLPQAAPALPSPEGYAGEIRAFAGPNPPAGWILCDGREVKEADYPQLYAAIGDLWGASAPGKFKLPDLRGSFLRGWNEKRSDNWSDPEAANR